MSAESPRHARSGGPLTVPSQPPSDRGIIDAVSGFINDVTLSSSSTADLKDVIQWARFETADINEPTPEGDSENDISPLLLILGYGSGVQVWLIPPCGEAQEVLSWRQGTVRVLRILPTPQRGDCFASKRPLIALCDSASPGPSFCSLSFISIRGGEQVKSIKFKNPILDVLANKGSVVISFSERFAVFDAATLEDRMAVTTCYPCPCPLGGSLPINPLALGDRWLAYADKKLNQSKRSSGGCEGEGVTSYTATVLHAAKSLSKGLRGLGESVAHSLSGGRSTSQSPSPPNADIQQPGVVTIIDIEGTDDEEGQEAEEPSNPIKAHFVAHSEAVIALQFDASGLVLVTADRRGHDFHVFRVHPHPCGPHLASVHHIYVLHRGDTTAKVQDIAISGDSRWCAVSTLRGTTHVFAMSPYGGQCGVRTHTQPRVVNRLSRFHRSAGLPIHAAAAKRPSGSPVADGLSHGAWFPNPRLPPYPLPITAAPLAQLRPTANIPTHTITRTSSGRQRLSSLSEDSNAAPLLARARFGPAGAGAGAGGGAGGGGGGARGPPAPVAALYLMAANGSLLHLLLHPRPLSSVPKEKICDESPIELEVEPVAQWPLQRPPAAADLLAPLPPSNPLLQHCSRYAPTYRCGELCMSEEERWLSQVEIVTHAGPHRRLWMGPQFVFKTYNCTGSSSSLSEAEAVEVEAGGVARSNPVNVPAAAALPVLVDSGSASFEGRQDGPGDAVIRGGHSKAARRRVAAAGTPPPVRRTPVSARMSRDGKRASSLEHSPSDSFRRKSLLAETGRAASVCDVQLREDLAEAMKEDHGASRSPAGLAAGRAGGVARAVDPLGTVVQRLEARPPPAQPDAELYVSSNCDEARFRAVVRAAAPPAAAPEAAARALPRGTTIPVQSLPAPPEPAAAPPDPLDPLPLSTAVVIPAALTHTTRVPHMPHVTRDHHLDKPSLVEDEREAKDARPSERARERRSATVERNREGPPEPLPRSDRPSDDIQPARPRVKRSPTPQSDSGRAADASSKDRKCRVKPSPRVENEGSKSKARERKEPEVAIVEKIKIVEPDPEPIAVVRPQKERPSMLSREKVPSIVPREKTPPVVTPSVSLKGSAKETTELKSSKKKVEDEIKTEEQAWDMLLSEPEKPVVYSGQPLASDKSIEEPKPKTNKKNRKAKKSQDDAQAKAEEDMFIEIHAIEEKQQPSSGELVSISMPYEDLETISFSAKAKKSRSSKSVTPERIDTVICHRKEQSSVISEKKEKLSVVSNRKECSINCEGKDKFSGSSEPKEQSSVSSEEKGQFSIASEANDEFRVPCEKKDQFDDNDIWTLDEPEPVKPTKTSKTSKNYDDIKPKTIVPEHGIISKEVEIDNHKPSILKVTSDAVETTKDWPKAKKTKSLSPYSERKSDKRQESEVKDVYVIDTVKEEFPEIQITKGSKIRKKSPQPAKKVQEKEAEVIKNPIKSAIDLVKPVENPLQYVENSVKSTESPIKPVVNPDKSVEKPVQSIEKLVKTVVNPVKYVEKPVQSVEKPIKSIVNPGKYVEKPVQSVENPVKSLVNPGKYVEKPVQSVENPVKSLVNPGKYVEKPVQSVENPVKSLVNPGKYVEKPVQSVENPVKSLVNPGKYVEKPVQSVENPVKSLVNPGKYVEKPVQSVENPVKSLVNPGKYVEKPVQSVENPVKSHVNPGKYVEKPVQSVDKPVQSVDKPVKSWSSIAASKSVKKQEIDTEKIEVEKQLDNIEKRNEILDKPRSSTKVSLQEKLFELCKRTDIMVAECDAPSASLNFVEEHHSVLHLPSSEPLDFGFDDFNLEEMRDSLLDANDTTSPICKINIDSIFSTIKETTSKAIESSAFNLIDLEKVPTKREEGFSVVENDKIKTQEVKIDEEGDDKDVMEKSSDEDITSPLVSTDSDKEGKKAGATNVTMPSSKQSSKSKKSRKKKK